jgi:hypothetical protein
LSDEFELELLDEWSELELVELLVEVFVLVLPATAAALDIAIATARHRADIELFNMSLLLRRDYAVIVLNCI